VNLCVLQSVLILRDSFAGNCRVLLREISGLFCGKLQGSFAVNCRALWREVGSMVGACKRRTRSTSDCVCVVVCVDIAELFCEKLQGSFAGNCRALWRELVRLSRRLRASYKTNE